MNKTLNVSVQSSKPKKISVKSVTQSKVISTTADSTQYYSNLAKNWAIGEGLIQNEDYSSKEYSEMSKEYSEMSKEYSETANNSLNNLENNIDNYNNQINETIQESLMEIATAKENTLTTISLGETTALNNISQTLESATGEIQSLANSTLSNIQSTGIDTRATVDLDNLSEKGAIEFLATTKLHNCALSFPERLKYKQDSTTHTLTILAGSVVIVPYGTEDIYNIGDFFINENYKVVDKQYGTILILWVELLTDISLSGTVLDTSSANRFITIDFTNNALDWVTTSGSGDSNYTTAPTSATIYYNIGLNKVQKYTKNVLSPDDKVLSLPVGKISSCVHDDVNYICGLPFEPFRGQGYIGTKRWVDKGIKYLVSDWTKDGSRKSHIHTHPCFNILETSTQGASYVGMFLSLSNVTTSCRIFGVGKQFPSVVPDKYSWIFYNTITKHWYQTSGSTTPNWGLREWAFIGLNRLNTDKTELRNFVPSVGYPDFTNFSCSPFWWRKITTSTEIGSGERPKVIVNSYVNGTTGYNVYSDGEIEQWGNFQTGANGLTTYTQTFPRTFTTKNYMIITQQTSKGPYNANNNDLSILAKNVGSFSYETIKSNNIYYNYYAKGY